MHYGRDSFKTEHINRQVVRSNKKRDGMGSFGGKENKTECTLLQSENLFLFALRCLAPNRYTIEHVVKYLRTVNLKKGT